MKKKLLSLVALWLALVLLVFVYTDREEYTWRYTQEDLGMILLSEQQAEENEAAAAAALAAEREEAAKRAQEADWDRKETYGGVPLERPAQDGEPGLNLMWGTYEVSLSYAAAQAAQVYVVSAGRQPFITGGSAALEPGGSTLEFAFTLTDSAEHVALACDLPEGAEIFEIAVHKAGAGVFSRDLAAYALLLGVVLTVLLVLSWDERPIGKERRRDALALVLAAVFAGMPLLFGGLYSGHDLHFHLNRIEGIASGLRAGQFPVRIHASTLLGYGYAAPLFYPELFLYIPAVMRNLGVSLMACVRVLEMGINLAAAFICYLSAQRIFAERKTALTASVLYTLCLYRLANMYVRATIGESVAMIFFPMLIAAMVDILVREERRWPMLALAMTGIFMNHLLSTLFAALFCAIAALMCAPRLFRQPKRILAILKAAAVTALCSLWFLVPMLTCSADKGINTSVALDASQHVLTLGGFLVGFPGDHAALPLTANDFSYTVGVVPGYAALVGCALLALTLYARGKYAADGEAARHDRLSAVLLGMGALALLLATNAVPWETLCYLPRPYSTLFMQIQFPWRFVGVASPLLCMAGAWGYMRCEKRRTAMLLAAVLLSVLGSGYMMQSFVQRQTPLLTKDAFCDSRIGQPEYLYHGTQKASLAAGEIVVGKGEDSAVYDVQKQGTNMSFVLDIPNSCGYVELPLMYYPGYHATAGDLVCRTALGENNVLRLYGVGQGMQIPVRVWYEPPAAWLAAQGVSLLGAALLAAALILMRRRCAA